MLNGLLFVPESQRGAFWSKCLLPAFPFLSFFFFWCLKCQQMRNNLYHLVSVVISNGWKGHNTADHTGEQWTPHTSPLKPFHLFTRIDWAKGGGEEKKFQGFYMSSFVFTRTPCKISSSVNYGLDGGSDSRIRYSHIWTGRTRGNAKSGSRITIRPAKTWAID